MFIVELPLADNIYIFFYVGNIKKMMNDGFCVSLIKESSLMDDCMCVMK